MRDVRREMRRSEVRILFVIWIYGYVMIVMMMMLTLL